MPAFSYRFVTDRVTAARAATEKGWRTARRAFDEARTEAFEGAREMGLPAAEGPFIDVGRRPGPLTRVLQGAAGAIVLALLAGGALSLFVFFIQLLLAYLLATEVLGLRFDIRPQAA